jgi:hypothetical protein
MEAGLGSTLAAEPRFSLDLDLVTSNGSDDRLDGTISLTGKLESLERPLIGSYSRIANCDGDKQVAMETVISIPSALPRTPHLARVNAPPPSARQDRPAKPHFNFFTTTKLFSTFELNSKEYEPHRGDDPVALRYSPDSP